MYSFYRMEMGHGKMHEHDGGAGEPLYDHTKTFSSFMRISGSSVTFTGDGIFRGSPVQV